MAKRILMMGSINIDLTMYADTLPKPGETVKTDNFSTFPGGKGGNQSAAAAKLGADVRYLTKLGDDMFSNTLLESQRSYGVDTSRIIIEKGNTAGIAMIMVNKEAQNSIMFTPGANSALTPEDVRAHQDAFDGCDFLEITMEIRTDTVYEAIRIAKEKGLKVILDPAPAPPEGLPADIISFVDYMKPNETETEILTGIRINCAEDAFRALDKLRSCGVKNPIVSLGKDGFAAYPDPDGEPKHFKAVEVNSIDTTAAGDIFLGALSSRLAAGCDFAYALQFANTAASLSTAAKGAQTSIPELDDVLSLMGERRS